MLEMNSGFWVQVLASLITSYVNLSRRHNLSEPIDNLKDCFRIKMGPG